MREVREVADRRVAVWLGYEDSEHQMTGEHQMAASAVENLRQERGAPDQTHTARSTDTKRASAVVRQPAVAQRRIDPEDGRAYSLEEMLAMYIGQYTKSATIAYWETCKVVGGHRRRLRTRC